MYRLRIRPLESFINFISDKYHLAGVKNDYVEQILLINQNSDKSIRRMIINLERDYKDDESQIFRQKKNSGQKSVKKSLNYILKQALLKEIKMDNIKVV